MTCIAWDGKQLAVDRRITTGSVIETSKKFRVLPTGEVLAFCGYVDQAMALFDWYEKGADPEKWPSFQKQDNFTVLVVLRDGKVKHFQSTPFPIVYEDDFSAWGSGCEIALGAMAMGASARDAVQVAARFNNSVGSEVDVFPTDCPPRQWPKGMLMARDPHAPKFTFSRLKPYRKGGDRMGGKNKPGREGKKPKGGKY